MSEYSDKDDEIDRRYITRVTLYDDVGTEIKLCYYTPDEISELATDHLYKLDGKSTDLIAGYINDYEEEYDLVLQDALDKKGNRIAAKIFISEDKTKNCFHYHRGEPFNLYNMAHSYTLNDEGMITSSEKMIGYKYFENNEHDHAVFTHLYYFKHNAMTKEVKIDKARAEACIANLSSSLIEIMGLN